MLAFYQNILGLKINFWLFWPILCNSIQVWSNLDNANQLFEWQPSCFCKMSQAELHKCGHAIYMTSLYKDGSTHELLLFPLLFSHCLVPGTQPPILAKIICTNRADRISLKRPELFTLYLQGKIEESHRNCK